MAFMLSGQEIHEWLGTGMLALFIIHHALNRSWLRSMGRGKYTPLRVIQTALVVSVSLSMLGSLFSGSMMSRYVFGFLPIHGGMAFARMLHMLSAYWGFIFLSAHLGLHRWMLMGMVMRAMSLKTGSVVRTFTHRILACGIAVYGVYVFGKHHIADYLLWRSMFVFFDYEQPPLQFLGEYLAMMGLWVFLVHVPPGNTAQLAAWIQREAGSLCYYIPWGNLCFFYQDFRQSPSLIPLGTVSSGLEHLEQLDTVASVTAEPIE